MTVPLTVRLGDESITRRVDNLSFRRNIHGDAECSFNLAAPLRRKVTAFERLTVHDGRSADIVWEGRLEDPGRSIEDGEAWEMSGIGEQARTQDRTAPYIAIDQDYSRWQREQNLRATSADASATNVPSNDKTDGLVMQYNPGQPVDTNSAIVMVYRAIEDAGMLVGGINYTVVAGFTTANYEARMWAEQNPAGTASQVRADTFDTTPTSRNATLGSATPLPAGTTAIQLISKRTGSAANVTSDDGWVAFYDLSIKAARYLIDGTLDTANASYSSGRGVYPHEIVTDVLVRLLSTVYDTGLAQIDTSSTYQLDQAAWPDGITAEQLFAELMKLEPDFYWHVGHSDPATEKCPFAWRKWPTRVRYEASRTDGLNLPGADAERYNRVTFRWTNAKGVTKTKTYDAGTTIAGIAVPDVAELATAAPGGAKLIRQPEIQDLSDEIGSTANADKAAAEFLLAHGTPPVSGTLVIARRIYDADRGRYVEPWEIEPGYLIRIRELADSAADLAVSGRDGKATFRIVGMDYTSADNTARLELDAPPRTDQNQLAQLIRRRIRKR